jgi:hypothetical protein
MVASKNELVLTVKQVLEVLELRLPESVFYWRVGRGGVAQAGSKAGSLKPEGYTQVMINGNVFYTHRLVWFVTYGKFPDNQVDHIDGDKSNNRIDNLRDVTRTVNMQNRPKYRRAGIDLPTGVYAMYNRTGEIRGYKAHWCDMSGKLYQPYFGIKKWHTLEAALAAAITKHDIEITNLKL